MTKEDSPKFGVVSFDNNEVQTKIIQTDPDTIPDRIFKVVHSFIGRYGFEPIGIILGLLDYIDLMAYAQKHLHFKSSSVRYEDQFMGYKITVSGAIRGIDIAIHPEQSLRLAPGIIRNLESK